MEEQDILPLLNAAPDDLIAGLTGEALRDLSEAVASPDRDDNRIEVVMSLSQLIHAQLVWRNLDATALDFFVRVNAIVVNNINPNGLMSSMKYSEYVEYIKEVNPLN